MGMKNDREEQASSDAMAAIGYMLLAWAFAFGALVALLQNCGAK